MPEDRPDDRIRSSAPPVVNLPEAFPRYGGYQSQRAQSLQAVPAALEDLVALTAFDEDRDGRADDVALAVDPDAAGPDAATVAAVPMDPVGPALGPGAQDLPDSGNLVV